MQQSPSKLFLSVKKSFSYLTSSASMMSADEPISQESYVFLENFCSSQKLLSVTIQKVNKIPDPLDSSSTYASYEISVLTDDVYYKVGKRYTEFKKLFDTVCRYHCLQIVFPRKTFWFSGAADSVTMQRQQQLNEFLQKIHKEIRQPNIGIPFLKFLQIQENYLLRGLTMDKLSSSNTCLNGNINEYILLQMLKLNANSQNIMGVLRQFQRCLIINKVKIQSMTMKNLINGSNDYMGLVQIIFTNENQLVVLEGLTLLLNLFNVESNISFDRYRKLYQSVPFSLIKELSSEFLKNTKIKKLFFELVNIYVDGKSQQQLTINQIFKQKKPYLKQFKIWYKQLKNPSYSFKLIPSQSAKSIASSFQFESSNLNRSKSEKIDHIQKEQAFFYTLELSKQQINSYSVFHEKILNKNNFIVQLVSKDNHFIQIHCQTTKSYEKLIFQMQSLQWCTIFDDVKSPLDNDALYCCLKSVDKSYRNLKFIVQVMESKNETTILFRPIKQIIGGIVIYIKVQIYKTNQKGDSKLRIIFYLVNSKAKKAFTQQVKTSLMESAVSAFLLSDQ